MVMKAVKILIVILLMVPALYSQAGKEIKLLSNARVKDTVWVKQMLALTGKLSESDPKATIQFLINIQEVSRKIGFCEGTMKAYLQQIEIYHASQKADSAALIATRALDLARMEGNSIWMARALIQLGSATSEQGNYDRALGIFEEALTEIDTANNRDIYASIVTNRANIRSRTGKNADAYNDYLIASFIFEEEKMFRQLAVVYNNLGLEAGQIELWDKAIAYYQKSIDLCKKKGYTSELPMVYSNLGTAYKGLKRYDEALVNYKESISIAEKLGQSGKIAQNLLNIGNIFLNRKELDSALAYYRESQNICYKYGIFFGIMLNHLNIGEASIKKGDLADARVAFDSAVVYAKKYKSVDMEHQAYSGLADVYEKMGDHGKALNYLRKYAKYRDSVNTAEIAEKMLQFEKEQESNRHLTRISKLENEAAERRFFNILLVMLVILSLMLTVFFIYKRKVAQREELIARENAAVLEKLSKELAESNVWKTKLFSVISHDIKGPFFPILSFSEMLAKDIDTLSREEITEFAGSLNQASKNVYFLIENLLDWAKLQQEKPKPELKPVLLCEVVKKVESNIHYLLNEEELIFENSVDDQVLVLADERMIYSIFHNLLHNAAKFSFRNGKISVTSETAGEKLVVKVKDDGTGMTAEMAGRLFSPGLNLSTRGTSDERGTGLGMTLVGEFVALNNGTISVESEKGKGTGFTIQFKAL